MRGRFVLIALVAVVASAFSVVPANASMIVAWDFGTGEGTLSAQDTAASFVDSNVTATTLVRSNNLSSENFVIDYNRTIANAELGNLSVTATAPAVGSKGLGTAAGGVLRIPSDLLTAPAADKYFTFGIAPNPGYQMTVTELSFDITRAGGSHVRSLAAAFSLDGFNTSTDIGTADMETGSDTYTFAKASFDLSGIAALEALSAGTTLEFRFYPYSNNAQNNWTVIDNLNVSGSVIPEPASVALLGLGLVAGAWLRRRHR